MLFGVENINNLIDLIGIGTCERHDFIILRHFIQKMFSVRPKNVAF
jgi:hypothetical protein